MQKRILTKGFMHETNTFSQLPTTLESYKARTIYYDNDGTKKMGGTRTKIAGFINTWKGHDWQGVFPIFAYATPARKVTGETFEHVANTLLDCLKNHGPFDSVCLALHRAMVCTHVDDGEGELLRRFGDVVGQDILIIMTLDLPDVPACRPIWNC